LTFDYLTTIWVTFDLHEAEFWQLNQIF